MNGVDSSPLAIQSFGVVNSLPQSPQPQPHTTSQDQKGAAQRGRLSIQEKNGKLSLGWTDGADEEPLFEMFLEDKVDQICSEFGVESPVARLRLEREQRAFTPAVNARVDSGLNALVSRIPPQHLPGAAGSPAPSWNLGETERVSSPEEEEKEAAAKKVNPEPKPRKATPARLRRASPRRKLLLYWGTFSVSPPGANLACHDTMSF